MHTILDKHTCIPYSYHIYICGTCTYIYMWDIYHKYVYMNMVYMYVYMSHIYINICVYVLNIYIYIYVHMCIPHLTSADAASAVENVSNSQRWARYRTRSLDQITTEVRQRADCWEFDQCSTALASLNYIKVLFTRSNTEPDQITID